MKNEKFNPLKVITFGSVIIILLTMCLFVPIGCNPPTEDEPNLGGGIEQETLLVVDDLVR